MRCYVDDSRDNSEDCYQDRIDGGRDDNGQNDFLTQSLYSADIHLVNSWTRTAHSVMAAIRE